MGSKFFDTQLFSSAVTQVGEALVHVGFTGKDAGNLGLHVGDKPETVVENRLALEENLSIDEQFIYLHQVHGTEVYDADSGQIPDYRQRHGAASAAPKADAAVTSQGIPLAVMVADCIPLIFVGEVVKEDTSNTPVLAVAHAGRRGLLAGVIQNTVMAMVARGAQDIRAWLGPSICGSCYEVPADMREQSRKILEGIGSTTSWGTPALDLPSAAYDVLTSLPGVRQVYTDLAACTLETQGLYSHRRGGDEGRFAGLVWVDGKKA